MSRWLSRAGQHFMGLVCGTTLAYVIAMLLSLMLASWPFNTYFTLAAVFSLLLQLPYWFRVYAQPHSDIRTGVVAGLILVGALWLLYTLG